MCRTHKFQEVYNGALSFIRLKTRDKEIHLNFNAIKTVMKKQFN